MIEVVTESLNGCFKTVFWILIAALILGAGAGLLIYHLFL